MARRQCVLRHDFGGGEIALEPEPAGLAEDASARAAHLRGDADRPALAGTEVGDRLMDEHGLDHLAVIEPTAKRTVPSASAMTSAAGRANDASSCASSFPEGLSGAGRPAACARTKRASARAAPGVAPRDRAQPESASSVMPKGCTGLF